MTRTAAILLATGMALFVALLAWHGFDAVAATLMVAGWGLLLVAGFHVLPLIVDAWAIDVLLDPRQRSMRDAVLARWTGESVNSLVPGGQIGGPIAMVRYLAQRHVRMRDAAAVITVSTTLQALAQVVFIVVGIAAFAAFAEGGLPGPWRLPLLATILLLVALVVVFYRLQRHGFYGLFSRLAHKTLRRDGAGFTERADDVDVAVRGLYAKRARLVGSFVLSLVGWLVGAGEVWLALFFLGHPVSCLDALLVESVGQAVRGAAFMIPGSLGVQEGGYLLLGPLVGIAPETALALSLARRARELALGLPGILYLHWSERATGRVRVA